jgi:hypothetical protein
MSTTSAWNIYWSLKIDILVKQLPENRKQLEDKFKEYKTHPVEMPFLTAVARYRLLCRNTTQANILQNKQYRLAVCYNSLS